MRTPNPDAFSLYTTNHPELRTAFNRLRKDKAVRFSFAVCEALEPAMREKYPHLFAKKGK